jgi:hypothetical protein
VDELYPQIHCIEDTSPFPHLTQSVYEESLINTQINELSRGEKPATLLTDIISGQKRKKGILIAMINPS